MLLSGVGLGGGRLSHETRAGGGSLVSERSRLLRVGIVQVELRLVVRSCTSRGLACSGCRIVHASQELLDVGLGHVVGHLGLGRLVVLPLHLRDQVIRQISLLIRGLLGTVRNLILRMLV